GVGRRRTWRPDRRGNRLPRQTVRQPVAPDAVFRGPGPLRPAGVATTPQSRRPFAPVPYARRISMRHQPNRAFPITRRTLLGSAVVAATAPVIATSAQTPASPDEIDFHARIDALLAAMPASAMQDQGTFFYADLAGQLSAAGVERPSPSHTTRDVPNGYF